MTGAYTFDSAAVHARLGLLADLAAVRRGMMLLPEGGGDTQQRLQLAGEASRLLRALRETAPATPADQQLDSADSTDRPALLAELRRAMDALAAADDPVVRLDLLAEVARLHKELGSAELPVVELAGDELGEFTDTPEGKKELRRAAENYLKGLVGRFCSCPALGADIEIRSAGNKKLISLSADSRKLRLAPAIPQMLREARKLTSKPPYDGDRDKSAIAYHILRAGVLLAGEHLAVRLVIKEDVNGSFHYDMSVHDSEAILDSAKEKGRDESRPLPVTTTNGRGTYPSRIARHQLDASVGAGGGEFKQYDQVASSRMVFNLFIEGEPPEPAESADE